MASFDTNVDYSETRSAEVNAIGWVFTGLAMAAVALKLFARIDSKRFGWDDFFIFFSLVRPMCSSISCATTKIVTHRVSALLLRLAEHGIERYEETAFWQIIAFPFNIGAFSFPNISIAILIVNLLDPNPLRARLLYAMVTLQVVSAMVSVFIVFFQCNPPSMLWDLSAGGTCWSPDIFDGFNYFVSAWTTLTDIILAFVPIVAFCKLQMPVSTKASVCIMMGLTLLSAIVTIVKATYLKLFTNHADPLFKVVPLVLWGLVEQNVVIIAACIPTIRPLFRKVFGSTKNSSGQATSRSGTGLGLSHSHSAKQPSSNGGLFAGEMPLEDIKPQCYDAESSSSQQGIWRTREVMVESDEERFLESGREEPVR
ncbi:uncharacterized protein N7515_002563 [Penicillium bovifimosum]|uniref:Rhodopsin domain-containing protein n=1 Tax=Penicillium bovifimosum TaxID=126998 RepID=A0A9W9L9G6_9EURO|nr:uncharacterized protein N7515_002563 [Penicillium bovifimosum]KAJ5143776.1 hypothetical protein N7515_002563 [Penicillium bovifimosum]